MNTMKPGKNGYKIFFNENTVVMNYKFASAAGQFGTREYEIIKGIRADFPQMKEVVVSGRERKNANENKRLTYENMEIHIQAYENSDELLEVFETVKSLSKAVASPYKYVSDWFRMQFPNYKAATVLAERNLMVLPVSAPDPKQYKVANT